MTARLWLAFGLMAALGLAVAATLRIDTDARGLLGPGDDVAAILDTAEGRLATLAIVSPDRELRNRLAADLARDLAAEPMVAHARAMPEAPSAALVDWAWRYRFVLAPPVAEDFAPDRMAAELAVARAALTSLSEGALAERYLADPTGSFRRLVAALRAAGDALPRQGGVPQGLDGTAALVFLAYADAPFDAVAEAEFDARLTQRIHAAGAGALLVGPRPVSARISAEIALRSKLAAAVAGLLLLGWLAAVLRRWRSVLACLLPLALGLLAAALAVRLAFGGLHVIALGFGGALMGLAMDYPVHLLAHRGQAADLARARRYVGLCAATTGIAFLALVGSGIPALAQVGVFVAVGLGTAAAAAALVVGPGAPALARLAAGPSHPVPAPWKWPVLLIVAAAGVVVLWNAPDRAPERLVEPPEGVVEDIRRMGAMIDLPSARYRIEVTGETLAEVLDRQARLGRALDAAATDGLLRRAEMLATHLPPRPASAVLPPPEMLAEALPQALSGAGLAPDFAPRIVDAYRQARALPAPDAAALAPLLALPEIAGLFSADDEGLVAPVRLWDVRDPQAVAARIATPGVAFIHAESAIARSLATLTFKASLWMALGAAAGVVFLLAATRPVVAAVEIVLACGAAGFATAAAASLIAGGLGLFHMVALALVVGIGIDYGLFLTLSAQGEDFARALRSVLVCGASTLIAFLTMAFSGVNVLADIGTTVSIGVVAMLAAHLLRRAPAGGRG